MALSYPSVESGSRGEEESVKLKGLAGLIGLFFLMAAPSAGAQLPVGEADGVRIFRERGAIVVKFTPRAGKLWRLVAGRRVSVSCTNLPRAGKGGSTGSSEGGTVFRAPKRGRTLRTGDRSRGLDYCEVSLARQGDRLFSLVEVDRPGLGERNGCEWLTLSAVLSVANLVASEENLKGYPTHAQLIDFLSGFRPAPAVRRFARRIVALASPADTPPAGKVGYYSDGGERVAAVILSRSARRLFIEFVPDDVLRTNVADFILGDGEP